MFKQWVIGKWEIGAQLSVRQFGLGISFGIGWYSYIDISLGPLIVWAVKWDV